MANITNIFVLISLDQPRFDYDQASRFLLTAENTRQKVSLILTKKDLITQNLLNQYLDRLNQWGYNPYPISVKTGDGVQKLKNTLTNSKIGVFCGPSGAGKSSLLNYLLPYASIPVGDLSKKLSRGKHTTRNVELFQLTNNSLIADTPGFNRPEIDIDPKELAFLFPEIRQQIHTNRCKFRDCLHLGEPGCALDKKFERYSNYKQFLKLMINRRRQYQAG